MTTTAKKTTTKKDPLELPLKPFAFEVFNLTSKQRSKAKKVEILQEYANDALKVLLVWNFDDTAISVIPKGTVPYTENEVPVGTDHTSLRVEYKHLFNFVKGGNDSLTSLRRETMFIQILEGLHPDEAKILCLVKDKELQTKYKLTYEVVREAYPDIKWGGRS